MGWPEPSIEPRRTVMLDTMNSAVPTSTVSSEVMVTATRQRAVTQNKSKKNRGGGREMCPAACKGATWEAATRRRTQCCGDAEKAEDQRIDDQHPEGLVHRGVRGARGARRVQQRGAGVAGDAN